MPSTILWIIVLLLLLSLVPGVYGARRDWGYVGWSPLGILLVVVIILAIFGRL